MKIYKPAYRYVRVCLSSLEDTGNVIKFSIIKSNLKEVINLILNLFPGHTKSRNNPFRINYRTVTININDLDCSGNRLHKRSNTINLYNISLDDSYQRLMEAIQRSDPVSTEIIE